MNVTPTTLSSSSSSYAYHDHHLFSQLPSVISVNAISIIAFGISVLLLCTHLVVHSITEDMRTLTGNSLASFCLSLLLSYCAYIGGMVVQDTSSPCAVVALLAFYLFSANSSWLLSISLQLYKAAGVFSSGRHHRNGRHFAFVWYSAFSWLQPAVYLGAALGAQTYGGNVRLLSLLSMPNNLRVDFFPLGTNCFNRNTSLLIWFLVLFNVNLTATFVVSALTASVAGKAGNRQRQRRQRTAHEEGASATVTADSDDVRSNDQLFTLLGYYMKLSLLVGLVWIVGMIMIYFKAHLLQVVFAASNAVLSLYIFLVFTFDNQLSNVVFNDHGKSYNMDTIRRDREPSMRHHPQNAATMSDDV